MIVIEIEIEIERLSLQIVATASLEEEDEDATVNGVVGQGNAHGDDVRSLEVMMNVWMDDTKSICAGRLWGGARRLQTPPLRQKRT